MEEYVKLVGMKGNPYPYIKRADLYVQPSRFESFGLTIKEAMILEKPILSTDTLGAKEIIQNQKSGILCSCDEFDLAQNIKKFINSSNLFSNISFLHKKSELYNENKRLIEKIEELIGE